MIVQDLFDQIQKQQDAIPSARPLERSAGLEEKRVNVTAERSAGAEERETPADRKILAAIERLQARDPPVAITQGAIAAEAGVSEDTVTRRKRANAAVASAIAAARGSEGGLEERTVSWLPPAMATSQAAVLIEPGLLELPPGDELDQEVALIGLAGNIRAALGLEEKVDLRVGLLTEQNLRTYAGYPIIQVRRDPAGDRNQRLTLQSIPVVVARAVLSRRPIFYVDVPLYQAGLEDLTLPEVLTRLVDLSA